MEKFNDIFRLTANVFHGIIATEVFIYSAEVSVDQFKYFLLLTFFTIINVFTWNFILLLIKRPRGETTAGAALMTDDISRLRYRSIDVLGLTGLAVVVRLVAGVMHQRNVVLGLVARLVDIQQTYNRSPFVLLSRTLDANDKAAIDGRAAWIRESHRFSNYLRVITKDRSLVYEGHAALLPGALEQRELVLSPACRLRRSRDTEDYEVTPIDGPGVFLRITDDVVIEVLDWEESPCARLMTQLREARPKADAAASAPLTLLCERVSSLCRSQSRPAPLSASP